MQTILLADDNQSIRAGLRKILAEHITFAHRVLEAENGQKAMELMRREPVDILVADIKMPQMDGIQLLTQLKQECRLCEVIMLSGYDDYSLIRSALKLNAFDYLLKPVNIPIFVQVVNHARQKLSERKNIPPAAPAEPGAQAAADAQAMISMEFFDDERMDLDPSLAAKCLDEAMAHAIALKPGKAADCFDRFFGCLGPGSYTQEAIRSMLTQWVYDLMKKSNGFIEIIGTSKLTADDVMNCIKSLPTLSQLRVRFPEIILSYINRLSTKPEQTEKVLIRRAKGFIEENYSNDISLENISKSLHLHPNYFSTVFKTETGMSFREYRLNYLVEKAKELLAQEAMNIAEIAEHLGYQETSHFNRAFKNITGSTPSQYRRAVQAEELSGGRNGIRK